jgi:hypothetical protein
MAVPAVPSAGETEQNCAQHKYGVLCWSVAVQCMCMHRILVHVMLYVGLLCRQGQG